MANQVVLLYDSDTSEFVEVDGNDSAGHSGPGSNSLSGTFGDGSSISTAYCQCDEDTLVECHTCGSFFEPDTVCPCCSSILE